MTPQYQFNLGQTDPLLGGRVNPNEDYFTAVNQEIERLNKIRTQLVPPAVAAQPQVNVWEETFGLKMKMLVLVKYGIISKKFKEVFILKVKR